MPNGNACPHHSAIERLLGALEAKLLGATDDISDVREMATKAGTAAHEVNLRVSRLFWIGTGVAAAYGLVGTVVGIGVALVRLGVIGG